MVTTRSADKRLDPSKEDELVLRSRRIGSPRSATSTPSHPSKRTIKANEENDGIRSKRARFKHDNDTWSPTSSILVNIPPRSTNHASASASQPDSHDSESTPRNLMVSNATDGDATPTNKPSTILDTPDQGNEAFKTPATSRHKRFDSEDLDEETIIMNAAVDLTTAQGYQTAEEEIADSDDEAPEVETTKIAPNLPPRRSRRTPKSKRSPEKTPAAPVESDDIIEVIVSNPMLAVPASQHAVDKVPAGEDEPASKSGSSTISDSTEPQIIDPQSSTRLDVAESTPERLLHMSSVLPTSQKRSASALFKEYSSEMTEDNTNHPALPTPDTLDLNSAESAGSAYSRSGMSLIVSDIHGEASLARGLPSSGAKQVQRDEDVPLTRPFRLPAKTTTSLSSYRRDKMQCRVGTSAGAFKMQEDWSKKRSSFVIS